MTSTALHINTYTAKQNVENTRKITFNETVTQISKLQVFGGLNDIQKYVYLQIVQAGPINNSTVFTHFHAGNV